MPMVIVVCGLSFKFVAKTVSQALSEKEMPSITREGYADFNGWPFCTDPFFTSGPGLKEEARGAKEDLVRRNQMGIIPVRSFGARP